MTAPRHPEPGWYVIERIADGAISCLYTNGKTWARSGRRLPDLPPGWKLGPRVDALLRVGGLLNADPHAEVGDG